jgi:hypothetical protein
VAGPRLGEPAPVSLDAVVVTGATAPQAQTGAAVEWAAREAQAASANVVVDGEQLNRRGARARDRADAAREQLTVRAAR